MRKPRVSGRVRMLVAALSAVLLLGGCVQGKSGTKVDFPTKEITWIVPTPPGGGLDTFTRVVAEQMKNHLPNQVPIIVKNVSGGQQAVGNTETLMAKPDGYTIGTIINGSVVSQLLNPVTYDLNKAEWIGNMVSTPMVMVVQGESPYQSVQDLIDAGQTKELRAPHPGVSIGAAAVLAAEAMGIKARFIAHAGGMADARTALIRGDGDFLLSAEGGVAGQLKSGELRAVAVFGKKRSESLPDVPTIVELGYPELVTPGSMNFLVAIPPGLPAEAASILREAFRKTMADPATQEGLIKAKGTPDYMDYEQATKVIDENFDVYSQYLPILKERLN